MAYLLDTHIFLWWAEDSSQLSRGIRCLLADPGNVIHISAASAWEISVKRALSRIQIRDDEVRFAIAENGFRTLTITIDHALRAGALPAHHRDPFDRMLIAQALLADLTLITADRSLSAYEVDFLWA